MIEIILLLAISIPVTYHVGRSVEIHSYGDYARAADEYVLRVRDVIYANTDIQRMDRIRRHLLPTDAELKAFGFSDSMTEHCVELREGTSRLLGTGLVGADESLRIDESDRVMYWRTENTALRQQLGFAPAEWHAGETFPDNHVAEKNRRQRTTDAALENAAAD